MPSHITIAVLLMILTGAAGCMTSNGALHSTTQTTNGGSSSPGGSGGMAATATKANVTRTALHASVRRLT